MRYSRVRIAGISYELPPVVVSSEELERRLEPVYRRLGLNSGRLELMTGIRERRFWNHGTLPSDGAVAAARKIFSDGVFPRDKVGALLMCSVSRDCLEPATATIVHHSLGLPEDCLVFDVSNACLGVLTGILQVANMIELGQIDCGLLVAGENSRPLVESTIEKMLIDEDLTRQSIKPYFASLTIGSGAVAVLLTRDDLFADGHRLLGGSSLAFSAYHHLCRGNADKAMSDNAETLMNTDAEELLQRGVEVAAQTWLKFKHELGWSNEAADCVCTHQVGAAHRRLLYEALNLDLAKDYPSIEKLGNVGSVSCPITVAMAAEAGRIKSGDKLAMLGIGSGINCTMLGVEW